MKKYFLLLSLFPLFLSAQKDSSAVVYPKEIHDVLNNPGIGFTTFQRFNGDDLNDYSKDGAGWTEGFPIDCQDFNGDLTNKDYPQTSIAYFRVYWKFIEQEQGQYNWEMLDRVLQTAAERGQTLMFRIAPYGSSGSKDDVPAWYRKLVGKEKKEPSPSWRIDHNDPRYLHCFGALVRALGQRYDGHPDLESVDVSFVGFWGEGAGLEQLTESTRTSLINSYLDNFKKTPLNFSLDAAGKLSEAEKRRHYVSYRFDCLGDYYRDGQPANNWGNQGDTWSHHRDLYPMSIIRNGMEDAWKTAPVSLEICWVFNKWLQDFQYDEATVEYIFNEALKWHISSFNAKSSPVPEVWSPLVNKWLNRMGYRFVLRRMEYPATVHPQGQLAFSSLWENVGVAPVYKDYVFALRLRNEQKTLVLPASANLRGWMPGDILHDEKLYIPLDMPEGKYRLEIGIVTPASYEPRVKLAIEGKTADGWYDMGEIEVKK